MRTADCTRCRRRQSSVFQSLDLAPRSYTLLADPRPAIILCGRWTRARRRRSQRQHRKTSPWRVSIAGTSVPRPSASSPSRCSAASMPATSSSSRLRQSRPGSSPRPPRVVSSRRRRAPDAGDGLFKALRGGMGELVSAIESRLPAGSVRVRTGAQAVSFAAPVAGRDRRRNVRGARGHPGSAGACGGTTARRRRRPARGALRGGAVRIDGERRARVAASERRSPLWPAAASSSRASTANCVSAPARGCRRSGRTGRGRTWCCCARFSAARRIQAPSTCPMPRSSTSRPRRFPGPAHHGRAAPRPVQRWRARAPSTTSAMPLGSARIEQRLETLPGLFVAGSGFRAIGVPDCIADGRAAAARAARVR